MGTKRWEVRWGRAEAGGRADRRAKRAGVGVTPDTGDKWCQLVRVGPLSLDRGGLGGGVGGGMKPSDVAALRAVVGINTAHHHRGNNLRGVFFGRAKIRSGRFWYYPLEMKGGELV